MKICPDGNEINSRSSCSWASRQRQTLSAARHVYFWLRKQVDVNEHVGRCISCAKHKGIPTGPAPILEYPPPTQPWDVVSIDLPSRLVCVDDFSREVVLAPIQNKTATAIVHALIAQSLFQYTTPHVLFSGNGAEFHNQLLSDDLFSVRK